MTRILSLLILAAASMLASINLAAADSTNGTIQPAFGVKQPSAPDVCSDQQKASDTIAKLDRDPMPAFLEAQLFPVSNVCYPFAGGWCTLAVFAPVGTPCHCGAFRGTVQ